MTSTPATRLDGGRPRRGCTRATSDPIVPPAITQPRVHAAVRDAAPSLPCAPCARAVPTCRGLRRSSLLLEGIRSIGAAWRLSGAAFSTSWRPPRCVDKGIGCGRPHRLRGPANAPPLGRPAKVGTSDAGRADPLHLAETAARARPRHRWLGMLVSRAVRRSGTDARALGSPVTSMTPRSTSSGVLLGRAAPRATACRD